MRWQLAFLAAAAWAQNVDFAIDPAFDPGWQRIGEERRGNVTIRDVSYRAPSGGRIGAYLVEPAASGKRPGALFIHWHDSEAPNSNRTQFLEEAVDLARNGLYSMLVSTPWSDPEWYVKRDVAKDYENSVAIAKDLRWAWTLLSRDPRLDASKMALVGHDFGAMYGILAVLGGPKPAAVALQAFTSSFSDWFLYNQRQRPAEAQQAVVDRLRPLDPLLYLPKLGAPALMQFAVSDFYVPRAKADVLTQAVTGPLRVEWYESGHGLNAQAIADRKSWLRAALGL